MGSGFISRSDDVPDPVCKAYLRETEYRVLHRVLNRAYLKPLQPNRQPPTPNRPRTPFAPGRDQRPCWSAADRGRSALPETQRGHEGKRTRGHEDGQPYPLPLQPNRQPPTPNRPRTPFAPGRDQRPRWSAADRGRSALPETQRGHEDRRTRGQEAYPQLLRASASLQTANRQPPTAREHRSRQVGTSVPLVRVCSPASSGQLANWPAGQLSGGFISRSDDVPDPVCKADPRPTGDGQPYLKRREDTRARGHEDGQPYHPL